MVDKRYDNERKGGMMATEKKATRTVGKKREAVTAAGPEKASVAKKVPVAKKRSVKADPSGKVSAAKKDGAQPLASGRTGEDVFNRVQQEAYYLAERDGFRDDPVNYWLTAEVNLGLRSA